MNVEINEDIIRNRCTDAVFKRGQTYRKDGRIHRLDRFDTVVTAAVSGSHVYDVTIELHGSTIDARCSCPYDGAGDCKHVVAVLLDIAANPPRDESEHVGTILEDVSPDNLRTFVRDVLAKNPNLKDQFLARFGDSHNTVDDYRAEIERLFDQHTREYPVVTDTIGFSHLFRLAEQYRDRDRHLAAATVYRALFEEIDNNMADIDAAYDHYRQTLQSSLDGYVDCVLDAELDPEEFEQYAGVLDERASIGTPSNRDLFRRKLDELENR